MSRIWESKTNNVTYMMGIHVEEIEARVGKRGLIYV
jgi:hypothetical protein